MTSLHRRHFLPISLCLLSCSPAERQLESQRRFISTVYSDTTWETFDRTTRAVTGLLVQNSNDSIRFRIRAANDDLVAGVDFTLHPATRRGQPSLTRRVGMPKGTLPLMGNSGAVLEQLLRRAKALGGDSVTIPILQVGADQSAGTFTLINRGPDSLLMLTPDGDPRNGIHLAVDSLGHILGVHIPLSGLQIQPLAESMAH
jgi:hypothetical protein